MNASEHMEWIGLLRSCTAFEAYCKVYTADLRPERVAEFLLLNAEFPHSVRFAVDHLQRSLEAMHEATARKPDRLDKLAGRLTAALSYTPLEEIMGNLHEFSLNIQRCAAIFTPGSIRSTSPIRSRQRWKSDREKANLMFYSIRHLTQFRYSSPVSESTMELRMQPRSEGLQRCLTFQVTVTPRTRVQIYRDYLGNTVHHFDVPSAHQHLTIIAEAIVDVAPSETVPPRLGNDAWDATGCATGAAAISGRC